VTVLLTAPAADPIIATLRSQEHKQTAAAPDLDEVTPA
jgi:hypothetical protein